MFLSRLPPSAAAQLYTGRFASLVTAAAGRRPLQTVVTVAQLVEPWTVTPVVAGSNPVSHPTF